MESNRVLTRDEALARPDGTTVWVEERWRDAFQSQIHSKRKDRLIDSNGRYYDVATSLHFGSDWRVWLHEPTPDELAANPWKEG